MRSSLIKLINVLFNRPLFLFLIWALWLSAEYVFLGPFSYVRVHDVGDSALPMRLALIDEFLKNGFFYWFPYEACGSDRLSFTFLNFLQVDSLLFFTLPGWLAYGLTTLIQRFIAGYFTYRVCKDFLCLDRKPSIVAGLAYAISFSALLYGDAFHSILQTQFAGEMGFPFLLWSLESIYKKEKSYGYILSVLLGLFTLLSSNFAISIPFMLPMILVWFIFIREIYSIRFLLIYVLFGGVILLGNIPLIVALLANAPLSHRAYWPVFGTMGSLEQVFRVSLMGGLLFLKTNVIYLLLGTWGLLRSRLRDKHFIAVVALMLICGVGVHLINPFWAYYAKPYIGAFSGYQIDRFYQLAPFFAAISAGFGLHYITRCRSISPERPSDSRKINVKAILFSIMILFLVTQSVLVKSEQAVEWIVGSCYSEIYENPELQHLAEMAVSNQCRVATVAYGLHPAYANVYGLESVDGYVPLYPFRYQEFWGKVIEPLTLKDEYIYNYFHNWGSRIYLFEPSDGSFDRIENITFSDYYNLNLLSLANTRYIISRIPLVDSNLTLLPSQMPEQVNRFGTGKIADRLAEILQGRKLFIYKNENCMSRFFIVDRVKAFENSTQLLDCMGRADMGTLRNVSFIEEEALSKIDKNTLHFADGSIAIKEYSPDRICLKVNLSGSGILIATNSYSPYWCCQADGAMQNIFPVDGAFCGVYLRGGEMNVTLEYHPPYRSFY
jgi:hypothetical protein